MMKNEIELVERSTIICPHCEHEELGDLDDCDAVESERKCPQCNKVFYLTTTPIAVYTTWGYKKCEKCGKKVEDSENTHYCDKCLKWINKRARELV
jgi:predicted RNA-binding Zn-ribbon protein involved in translation (DUF1610 family)